MRKQTGSNDNKGEVSSEAKTAATRRPEPRSETSSHSSVACSSITLPLNSQMRGMTTNVEQEWDHINGVTGIDWFQLASCVVWDEKKSAVWFAKLRDAKTAAQQIRQPVLLQIGDERFRVQPSGQGSGQDAHKEITLSWREVQIGLSERNRATRQLSNASLVVSGKPCLVTGWADAWSCFRRVVEDLGGQIVDEWLRRLDICIDVVGLDFAETLYPLLRERQFITRCRRRKYDEEGDRATSFSVGKSSRLRVLIYDKLLECRTNQDAVYGQAMIQRRWGGRIPLSASRVEWQMGRPWLKQFGLDQSDSILDRLSDLYAKLTDETGGAFRITDRVPDRANQHQSRGESHPAWRRIVAIGRETMGNATQPLVRLDRSNLDESRAIKQVAGLITSIADRAGIVCLSAADAQRILVETLRRHKIGDYEIAQSYERKAKVSGTWQELVSFPLKEAA